MSRIYLIRHGRAAADWGSHLDPGLDDVGRAQAHAIAARLAPKGPLPLVASPLRRTRETAAALERQWATTARIEPRVGEIPSPIADLGARAQWLRGIMQRRWPELDEPLQRWRSAVLEALCALSEDTIVVSHYIAVNVPPRGRACAGRSTRDLLSAGSLLLHDDRSGKRRTRLDRARRRGRNPGALVGTQTRSGGFPGRPCGRPQVRISGSLLS